MAERYEEINDGNFFEERLVKDKKTDEIFAINYVERGHKIDEKVEKEIFNHRCLRHPHVATFKEVFVTPTHLAIVMEYVSGVKLYNRISTAGRFTEDEARFFFQQLISVVSYCHSMEICHRDLKLENTLLDYGSSTPCLKICDIGYSMSGLLHSQPKGPKRTRRTPVDIAPEVLLQEEYDGKIADAWSCGVILYVMLVGACPFEEPDDPRDYRKTIGRIIDVQYSIPDDVPVSADCQHLLSRIFVDDPSKRITIPEINMHPWFLKNLCKQLIDGQGTNTETSDCKHSVQSEEEIMGIIEEARKPGEATTAGY